MNAPNCNTRTTLFQISEFNYRSPPPGHSTDIFRYILVKTKFFKDQSSGVYEYKPTLLMNFEKDTNFEVLVKKRVLFETA